MFVSEWQLLKASFPSPFALYSHVFLRAMTGLLSYKMKADALLCFSFLQRPLLYDWAFWCLIFSSYCCLPCGHGQYSAIIRISSHQISSWFFFVFFNVCFIFCFFGLLVSTVIGCKWNSIQKDRERAERGFRKPLQRNWTLPGTLSHQLEILSGQQDHSLEGSGQDSPYISYWCLCVIVRLCVCVFLCTYVMEREVVLWTFASLTPWES